MHQAYKYIHWGAETAKKCNMLISRPQTQSKRCRWYQISWRDPVGVKVRGTLFKWCAPSQCSHGCPKTSWQSGPTDRHKINDLWQLQRARIWTVILQTLHKYKQLLFRQRLWFLTVPAPRRSMARERTSCHIQTGETILWRQRVL